MVWFDLDAAGCDKQRFVEVGVRHGVRFMGGRVVVHYREFCDFLMVLGIVLQKGEGGEGRERGQGRTEREGGGEFRWVEEGKSVKRERV